MLAVVLSENPDISVLVLEAGNDGRNQSNITDPERRGINQGFLVICITDSVRYNTTYTVRLGSRVNSATIPVRQRHRRFAVRPSRQNNWRHQCDELDDPQ